MFHCVIFNSVAMTLHQLSTGTFLGGLNERFRDHAKFEMPYFYLYTSVSLSRYPSLKPLDTKGRFYGTYFS